MSNDYRIYPTYERLSTLSKAGRALSWHPPYQRLTPLTGKHRSQQRGRGLDFVELRHYHAGDDVRHIDWKVTQRTGKPYLRVYAEENDKNIALFVDLRNSMFFASDGQMKSVVAAELAALCTGAACKQGDRVGAIILTHKGIVSVPFRRGEKAALALLQTIENCANQLPQWHSDHPAPSLSEGLKYLVDMNLKESQCFIISDFNDYDQQQTSVYIDALAKRNSLVGFRVTDPLEEKFPQQNLVMGDDHVQVEIQPSDKKSRHAYERFVRQQKEQLQRHFTDLKLALLDITTHQDAWTQLQLASKE